MLVFTKSRVVLKRLPSKEMLNKDMSIIHNVTHFNGIKGITVDNSASLRKIIYWLRKLHCCQWDIPYYIIINKIWINIADDLILGVQHNFLNDPRTSFQIESMLLVRSYLGDISNPELFCVLVAGMASTSGSSMIMFSSFGVNHFSSVLESMKLFRFKIN